MLTNAAGWIADEWDTRWFYLDVREVESVSVCHPAAMWRVLGARSQKAFDAWADGESAEVTLALVRTKTGAEHYVFGPAEDVASLVWGEVPCPP